MASKRQQTFSEFLATKLRIYSENTCSDIGLNVVDAVSYQEFFVKYLLPNKLCIFSSSLTDKWDSRKSWVRNGKPFYDFLTENYGMAVVPVANCKLQQYSAHPKTDMTLMEYLQYWDSYRVKGYLNDDPCLYLKDWHFVKAFPDSNVYQTPEYFQSDWLNEFWDTQPQDDYRFVYMGPKGTWTPFHSDVYQCYSWSANICGRKKWIFYPPGCEKSLMDRHGNLVYDVTSPEFCTTKYPQANKVKGQRIELIQEPGQIIFVPSGWHHQVHNLEDTISINHNWLNACNVDICWRHLKENLAAVKKEIADCKNMLGWHEQCQVILNASAGIDFRMFIQMLKVISANRLEKLEEINVRNILVERVEHTAEKESVEQIENIESVDQIDNIADDIKRPSNAFISVNSKLEKVFGGKIFQDRDKGVDQSCENDSVKVINCKDCLRMPQSHNVCLIINNGTACTNIAIAKDDMNSSGKHEWESSNDDNCSSLQCDQDHVDIASEYCHATLARETVNIEGSKELRSNSKQKFHDNNKETNGDILKTKPREISSKYMYYLMFDLLRIAEVLEEILLDEDYKSLTLEYSSSAEYVLERIKHFLMNSLYISDHTEYIFKCLEYICL